MIDLEEYIKTSRNDELSALIIKELRKVPDCNAEFILCVLAYMKTDSEKKKMIEYLQKGEDVTYEQILLNAVYILRSYED